MSLLQGHQALRRCPIRLLWLFLQQRPSGHKATRDWRGSCAAPEIEWCGWSGTEEVTTCYLPTAPSWKQTRTWTTYRELWRTWAPCGTFLRLPPCWCYLRFTLLPYTVLPPWCLFFPQATSQGSANSPSQSSLLLALLYSSVFEAKDQYRPQMVWRTPVCKDTNHRGIFDITIGSNNTTHPLNASVN